MYRLNRLKSANPLVALFAVSPAAATYQQINSPFRSIFSKHSSPAGVDDFVNVRKGGKCWYSCIFPNSKISGKALPSENESKTYERKVLPPELSRSVVRLTCESSADGGVCDVYLVGTIHVSKKSCEEVKAVIEFLKPQVVFLELCSSRRAVLHATEKIKVPTMAKMVEDMWNWKKNDTDPLGISYSWFVAKVASKLGVVPGAEFRVAYEEAIKYGGKCILGDRSILITSRRTRAMLPLWQKTKLMCYFLYHTIFSPSTEDLTKMLKVRENTVLVKQKAAGDADSLLKKKKSKIWSPTLVETLLHERDQYMSATLLSVAREHNSVVAVVGKKHLVGIQKNWKQPVDLKKLLSMPPEKRRIPVGKILTSIGATFAIISGIYHSI